MSSTLSTRAEKAAQILKTTPEKLIEVLAEEGVDDVSVVDSPAVGVDDLVGILTTAFPDTKPLPRKAAAGALKDPGREAPEAVPAKSDSVAAVATLVKELKPIEQWDVP